MGHRSTRSLMNPANLDTVEPDIAVAVIMDFAPKQAVWAWWRFLVGRFSLYRTPGLRFAKVLGCGHQGGFGLRPSLTVQGLFCVFRGHAAADAFLASPWLHALDDRTRQWHWLKLEAFSSRGAWSGHQVRPSAAAPASGPVASLTRASIRPARTLRFWQYAPPAERSLSQASGCSLAVGLGEAPVLRQATLSVWDSVADMDAYARSGAHLKAIQAAYGGRHFSESMFVRWRVLAQGGPWQGIRRD